MLKPDERTKLLHAKTRMVDALVGPGLEWLIQIITEGPARWQKQEDGARVLVEGNPHFEWAMNFAADRAGMKRETGLDVNQPGSFTIVVNDARGGLGWPGMAVGGGDDRDDGDRPSVAN